VSSHVPDDDPVIATIALGDDDIARLDAAAGRRGIARDELLGVPRRTDSVGA
jgi:hypothetical protein